ncbi:hypothetical protein JRO89_XS07G0025000 [Xanthoceras sorbifolium]|uniref:Large ribosomal subunit protein mL53 n=1 Tax=Xanthoceras sorbifolium TaxID=99658 RepID=A0ABQ8HS89_9ROSI|nr:hypothetical protein JRO89_XS07G0025000 [Xanthoceras sorbifolium]
MLKFLSKVRIEFNALDPRTASCMEFLAQCNARKAKESNPACKLEVKRRTDDHPPEIKVTFVNGVEEVFDATSTPAQSIRTMILEKGQYLETQQMFLEAGEKWPVIIPEEELHQSAPGTKVLNFSGFKIDFVCLTLFQVIGPGHLSYVRVVVALVCPVPIAPSYPLVLKGNKEHI